MSEQDMSAKEQTLFGKEKNPSNIQPVKLTLDSNIQFRCHHGVSCFTACCGSIKIVLTPYDIEGNEITWEELVRKQRDNLEKHSEDKILGVSIPSPVYMRTRVKKQE